MNQPIPVLLVLGSLAAAWAGKPTLGVYYESLCPYSRQFIRDKQWKLEMSHYDQRNLSLSSPSVKLEQLINCL